MEFAYVLKNYGVDVTIVEFLDRALPNEDADVSKEIAKQYKKLGITIMTGAGRPDDRRQRHARSPSPIKDDKPATSRPSRSTRCCRRSASRRASRATAWRTPASQLTDRGAIAIDEHMRTNVPHIYAIGDVTAKLQLAHVAEAQGVVAAETIARRRDHRRSATTG